MRLFGKNQEAIAYLTGKFRLLDAELIEVRIYKVNYLVDIDIHFQLTGSKLIVMLRFIDIIEYAFYHNNKHDFYCLATVPKFIINNNQEVYLSLDPDEMSTEPIESDNDIILSKGLEGYFVEEEQ